MSIFQTLLIFSRKIRVQDAVPAPYQRPHHVLLGQFCICIFFQSYALQLQFYIYIHIYNI